MRIFYTTDIHGSTLCFKKFLNAGKFYKANVIILGGDITGKMIIPLVEQDDGSYMGKQFGTTYIAKTEEELQAVEKKIEDSGYYPYRMSKKEMEEFTADKSKVEKLFDQLILERVEKWIRLAEERLRGQNIACYIQPGNDDRYLIDPILEKSDVVINTEGKVLEIDAHHEMISTGHSNITPWKCPRDVPEEKLSEIIEGMVSQVKNMKNCIFNFHCPPYDTHLDRAPELDENLTPKLDGSGGFKMIPVGSKSIRNAIEKYQPLLGLHGHIHESKASQYIGRTLCINPGSEYGEGILRGCLIELTDKGIKSFIFTQG